jgi:hypothetical protein
MPILLTQTLNLGEASQTFRYTLRNRKLKTQSRVKLRCHDVKDKMKIREESKFKET